MTRSSEGTSSEEALLALQDTLRSRLSPVKPDRKFVNNLRARLEESPVYLEQRRTAAKMLTIAAGLMFGLVVFLIGRGLMRETG